ncbi:MAG: molybdenum cofactor guanylyltransferase [Cyanobacteriota bacterium]|nr:molybdenum cofactor guanylyltransferase [Cyanobacteriota bacterium]
MPARPSHPPRAPLRCCLLSGGASRRMGRDKALLSHPEGGTWLERTLALLLALDQPVTLLSRHRAHWVLAEALQAARDASGRAGPALTVMDEPPPWEGPLRALARLVERYPGERLLLCPVDMPWLDAPTLAALLAAAANDSDPERIHLAHDGLRLQPLLAMVPATEARRQRLAVALAAGERGLQRWLAGEDWRPVELPPGPLRNINQPQDLGPSVLISAACGP